MNPENGFTASLRRRLQAALDVNPCRTCGHAARPTSLRSASRWIGVAPSTLWRFLEGKPVSSLNVDLIVNYLDKKGIPA